MIALYPRARGAQPKVSAPMRRHVTFVFRAAPAAAMILVLASCGSDSSDADQKIDPEGATAFEGYPLLDCSDANNEPCIEIGFDPAVHGFGFANWAEVGRISSTEMIALFGRNNVCAPGPKSKCELLPAAAQWATQVNEAMAGGHCEGMAVLATRLHRGDENIVGLDPDVDTTFELDPLDPDVRSAIETWFATQYLDPVVNAYQSYQQLTPSDLAVALFEGLADDTGYTMGIYSEEGLGHAITPIGVSFVDDQIAVSIYDNNYPGTVQRILIDPEDESWSYAGGTTEPNAPTYGWSGGKGTIELTPMNSRALPAPAPFSEKRSKSSSDKTQRILVTTPDPRALAGAVLEVDGVRYDLTDPKTPPPQGVTVRSIRSSTLAAGSSAIDIDTRVLNDYVITPTARVISGEGAGASIPVTISIDAVGKPRLMLQAKVVDQGVGLEKSARFVVEADGSVTAEAPEDSEAVLSIANGLSGATVDLDAEDSVEVETDDQGVATFLIFDEEGEIVESFEIDDETASGSVVFVEMSFDPETGEFELVEVEVEAEEVDSDWLGYFEEATDEGTDDEAGAGTEDESDARNEDDETDAGTEESADEYDETTDESDEPTDDEEE